MKRNATAIWEGGLKDGKGTLTTPSGVLTNVPYSFGTRFEDTPGTNPEELIAAAHAGCFSMALSSHLAEFGMVANSIQTTATVILEKDEAGFTIKAVHLDVTAEIPNATVPEFERAADDAKRLCPISRLLAAPITMNARLGVVAVAQT